MPDTMTEEGRQKDCICKDRICTHTHSFILEWNVPPLLCLRWWTVMLSNCTISSSFASLRDDCSLYHHKYYNLASRKQYLVTYVENKDKRILCSFLLFPSYNLFKLPHGKGVVFSLSPLEFLCANFTSYYSEKIKHCHVEKAWYQRYVIRYRICYGSWL